MENLFTVLKCCLSAYQFQVTLGSDINIDAVTGNKQEILSSLEFTNFHPFSTYSHAYLCTSRTVVNRLYSIKAM